MFGSQAKPAARTAALRVDELDPRINPDALAIDDVYSGRAGMVLTIPASIGVLANDLSPNNNAPNLQANTVVGLGLRYDGTPPVAGTAFPPLNADLLQLAQNGGFTLAIPDNSRIPDGATRLLFNYKATDQNQPASAASIGLVTINLVRTGDSADLFATGTGVGVPSQVRVFDTKSGIERFTLFPYEQSFTGGVRVATGDVNGDGLDDVITIPETGSGGAPRVRVFDGRDGVPLADFFAFSDDPDFRGGGDVAIGNVDALGGNDIIIGAGDSGGPRVQIYTAADLINTLGTPVVAPVADFFAYETSFRNGVRVSAGNIRGFDPNDQLRRDFIVTGAGVGGGPRVNVFDFSQLRLNAALEFNTPTPLSSFFAFDASNRGGVNVAVGRFRSDLQADIVAGQGLGGSNVRVFDGRNLTLLRERTVTGQDIPTGITPPSPPVANQGVNAVTNFGTGSVSNGSLVAVSPVGPGAGTGGVRVAVTDRNGDGVSDILVGLGIGSVPRARIFDGSSLAEIENFLAFPTSFIGGVFVGGNSLS